VAVAAGVATLEALQGTDIYADLEDKAAWLAGELTQAAADVKIPLTINRVGSMLTLFFQEGPVHNLDDAKKSDVERFAAFFQGMLAEGVYLPPSQFEAWFVSLAHTRSDLEATVAAARRVWLR
jgi:glutamate-1-semialdehyde 2,1-aminomutase